MLDAYPVHQGAYVKKKFIRMLLEPKVMDIVRKITLILFWAWCLWKRVGSLEF